MQTAGSACCTIHYLDRELALCLQQYSRGAFFKQYLSQPWKLLCPCHSKRFTKRYLKTELDSSSIWLLGTSPSVCTLILNVFNWIIRTLVLFVRPSRLLIMLRKIMQISLTFSSNLEDGQPFFVKLLRASVVSISWTKPQWSKTSADDSSIELTNSSCLFIICGSQYRRFVHSGGAETVGIHEGQRSSRLIVYCSN